MADRFIAQMKNIKMIVSSMLSNKNRYEKSIGIAAPADADPKDDKMLTPD